MNPPDPSITAAQQELLALSEESAAMNSTTGGAIVETMADWLAPQFALAARRQLTAEEGAERLDLLRVLVVDWTRLRRSHLSAERVQIERDRLELSRERTKERMEETFREWEQNPEKRGRKHDGVLSPEERAARIREILRYPPQPAPKSPAPAANPASHPPASTEANPAD